LAEVARQPHVGVSGLGILTVGVAFGSDDQQKAQFWAFVLCPGTK